MRVIGMINKPVQETPQEAQNSPVEATKTEMIEEAEELGIELTPAEKRLNKEKLFEVIESRKNNETVQHL